MKEKKEKVGDSDILLPDPTFIVVSKVDQIFRPPPAQIIGSEKTRKNPCFG